jgi:hypothetical protein
MTQPSEGGAGGSTSIFKRKTGPLANWMWMALLLLAALLYALWKRNRASADVNAVEEGPSEELPGDQTAPPVFILPQNPQPTVPVNVTVNNPATPPSAPPVGSKPVTPLPSVQPKPSAPSKSPAVAYDTVKVVKYTKGNAAWNSTLWGIAKQKGYGSASKNWASIWNDPKNAALKKKRGSPEKIQPGDVVYVRRK